MTGAGLLYRRTDQVADAPSTWQQLYKDAAKQTTASPTRGRRTRGLTCNFIELSSALGGRILSPDGKKASSTRRRT